MKYLEPQHMLGLRVMSKKGLDAYWDAMGILGSLCIVLHGSRLRVRG
jgi:hypothetical protein